jgi:HSP20 family protein
MNTTLSQTENRGGSVANTNTGAQQVRYLTPPANIWETGDGYVLELEMPGVNKAGLELTVENNELTISGRRAAWDIKADAVYRESRGFDYRRVFDLDPSIDASKITAKMEQGILTLTLPKAERVKPRKIAVTD